VVVLILLLLTPTLATGCAGMILDATVFKEMNQKRSARLATSSVKKVEQKLRDAAEKGDFDKVDSLLRRQVYVDACDDNRQTPLMKAARNGHAPVVRLLLGRGADANTMDINGRTAASLAMERGHRDVVQILPAAGAATDKQ